MEYLPMAFGASSVEICLKACFHYVYQLYYGRQVFKRTKGPGTRTIIEKCFSFFLFIM